MDGSVATVSICVYSFQLSLAPSKMQNLKQSGCGMKVVLPTSVKTPEGYKNTAVLKRVRRELELPTQKASPYSTVAYADPKVCPTRYVLYMIWCNTCSKHKLSLVSNSHISCLSNHKPCDVPLGHTPVLPL